MPHGDFSDLSAIWLLGWGIQQMSFPSMQLSTLGPLAPFFSVPSLSPEVEVMTRFCGSFMLILGCMLFTVRWNTINGKLSGLACIIAGINTAVITHSTLDNGMFVLRPFYLHAAVLVIAGAHLMFNANPVIKANKN